MLTVDVPPLMIIVIPLLVLIPLGMFLDPLSVLLIAVPLTYPLVTELGMDGIWFGILFVKMVELGLITPLLGINAFVVTGTTPDLTPELAFRGVLQYVPVDLVTISLLFAFPGIVTFLPALVNT